MLTTGLTLTDITDFIVVTDDVADGGDDWRWCVCGSENGANGLCPVEVFELNTEK